MSKRPAGFTILELMAAVAIVGFLAAIAIPEYLHYTKKTKRGEATAILHALSKAQIAYKSANDEYADDFNLLDSQGRKFDSSSDANTALASESGQDLLLSELQPGIPKKTKTAFLVPAAATEGPLRVRIPEKGFFSSGEVIILLKAQ